MPTANRAIRVPVKLSIIVRMEINKSRSDDEAAGINDFFGIAAVETADLGNLAILNTNVCPITRHTSSIDDRAIFNNRIELRHNPSLRRFVNGYEKLVMTSRRSWESEAPRVLAWGGSRLCSTF